MPAGRDAARAYGQVGMPLARPIVDSLELVESLRAPAVPDHHRRVPVIAQVRRGVLLLVETRDARSLPATPGQQDDHAAWVAAGLTPLDNGPPSRLLYLHLGGAAASTDREQHEPGGEHS